MPVTPRVVKKKICLLGDGAVGKTSLIRRYVYDKFDDSYITTIGTKIVKKTIELEVDQEIYELRFMIWDVLGQRGYQRLHLSSFRGAEGALMVCDLTRKETLGSLESYWIPTLRQSVGDVPFIILVNKSDLEGERGFGISHVEGLADKFKASYLYTSAKTGNGVEGAFIGLGESMLRSLDKRPIKGLVDVQKKGTLIDLADRIIADFVHEYGEVEDAMPIIRQQFTRSNVDVKAPTRGGLRQVVNNLAEVEKGFKSEKEVTANLRRRLGMLEGK